ncbi:deoxynucleoside triphosphate triphosphohydrolase SAMHD1-like [Micropterus dolomieu]|uniref:deoxynucleoside triphosphate triphosphohydrolase SAMHD1-like n=1 Tax=Micropterus dolomieu TaxID=147949 RepID=UPI001E8E8CA5|nr:deoxynucleoside triphosphate triphosphohydrolase SAMHD1-like [Micropterus dolomieu]
MEAQNEARSKVFNDPIHGHVELDPLLIKIIDTPQFQRLRNIKQLGGGYFVYPGASHNRFEHSIGVGYLAGQLVEALQTRQPELNIDERDILCVKIAGLCHDLGHGPFSHLFDQAFIPKARPGVEWKHEMASVHMFDHVVESIDLKLEEYGLVLPGDVTFIKEMISPEYTEPLSKATYVLSSSQGPYKGRSKDKSFLYEIVANKRNGVDVDKFDYFARDCHHLGIQNNFDHRRFLQFVRVCEVDGQKHICTRDKEEDNMYEMFHTRMSLHKSAYQHKVNKIIETMITEAFLKADEHIQIAGSGGKMLTLSTAIDDMEAYTKLTDHVFEQILNSSSPQLDEARQILRKIVTRDLYKFLGEIENPTQVCTCEMIPLWKEELAQELLQSREGLTPEDFEVQKITIDYGKSDRNPVEYIYFYSKYDPTEAFKMKSYQVSEFRRKYFSEQTFRFYCKKTDDNTLKADREHFDQWCRRKGFSKASGNI